jgi:cbb3-type cytochrome oxidase subunit 3
MGEREWFTIIFFMVIIGGTVWSTYECTKAGAP